MVCLAHYSCSQESKIEEAFASGCKFGKSAGGISPSMLATFCSLSLLFASGMAPQAKK
jgi:hypothetical protein